MTGDAASTTGGGRRATRLRRRWDREAADYDRLFTRIEGRMFPDLRRRLCGLARGETLDVAAGTGLNLPHYPRSVTAGHLTAVEWSPGMLDVARRRADALGLDVDLRVGDAQRLDLPDRSFDTVVCTFSLCAVADHETALAEMVRVLRPGGRLLLADHVASTVWPLRALQAAADLVSVPWAGEHFGRRPMRWVAAGDLVVEHHERTRAGVIEWVAARVPAAAG
ncbi:class I SAM-dependent methyltransferase [Isoptericola sp. BMS4]|uniref:class I SAM-dependent methyltransferase n=1 Tax=Isoptericola sp. BMS4 TaxID=2527875 RepID=UPI001F10AD58|nr:class I SAM-dependent methyltransferase [Isoptericola sp. BMS4]